MVSWDHDYPAHSLHEDTAEPAPAAGTAVRGSIYRRGDGWTVKVELPRRADGRRHYKYATLHGSLKEAERTRAKLVHEVATDAYFEPTKLTLAAYLDQWLDAVGDNLAVSTRQRYRQIIDAHIVPKLGHHRLDKLKPVDIQRFYVESLRSGRVDGRGPLAPASVRKAHQILRTALQQAVRWQMLRTNPAAAVDPPKVRRPEMTALTAQQTAQLLAVAEGDRLYVPVLVAVSSGLRRGELLGLRWRDLDLETGILTVQQALETNQDGSVGFKSPKTPRSRRSLPLGPTTVAALRRHRVAQDELRLAAGPSYCDYDLVFAQPGGRAWRPSAFSVAFGRLVRKSGLPHVRLHDLRHSHASQLLSQGVNVKVVSERLGHSSVAITLDVYAHTVPTMQAQAIEAYDQVLRDAMGASDEVADSA